MSLNGQLLRCRSLSIIVITLFLTVFIFSIYKYQNKGFNLYKNEVNKNSYDSSELVWRLKSIFKNMFDDELQKVTLKKSHTDPEDCLIPPLRTVYDFFNYGKRDKYKCNKLVEVGGRNGRKGRADGSKFVCFDDLIPGDCIVFSFGINNEWSFDDAMYNFGCIVYAFDPTMGVGDFDRTPRIHFFNLGLSDFKGKMMIGKRNCKVDRFENMVKMLNLTDKKIDYLKMDIEGSEINFFIDAFKNSPWIFNNVKQLAVEIHVGKAKLSPAFLKIGKNNFHTFWAIMNKLECFGYKLLHHEPNLSGSHIRYKIGNLTTSAFFEIVWIKK